MKNVKSRGLAPDATTAFAPCATSANQRRRWSKWHAQRTITQATHGVTDVYLLQLPLVGLEQLDTRLPAPLAEIAALHLGICVSSKHYDDDADGDDDTNGVFMFDYLPQNPTDPMVLAALLAFRAVPASAREIRLSGLPRQRCRKLGTSPHADALAKARTFQAQWDGTELKLLTRDCRHHVDSLADHLLKA
jgi:hypothetical protein